MCGPYGCPMFGGGWIFMIIMAVFWLLLLAGIVLIVVWLAGRTRPPAERAGETPLDILNRRYANGEITREEYERMRRDISPGGG